MMTDESSANSKHEAPVSLGVKIYVCPPASDKVHTGIHERDCASPTMKPSKRLPDTHKGKLVEGASNQQEATQSRRVTELAVT